MQYTLIALELSTFQKKLRKIKGNTNIVTNIYRIQAYDSIMCDIFVWDLFMLKGKSLLVYTNLFSPNEYEKNDKIISKYFQQIQKR